MMADVADTRCELTELYTRQCAHCRKMPMKPPRVMVGTWIKARYTGRCQECDYPIVPGEPIRSVGDGFICSDCGKDIDF